MSTRLEKMTNALKHTEKTMTFQEYADNLTALQKTATQLIMGKEFETGMRLEEAIAHMEYDVRKASLQKEDLVKQGMKALKTIEKEARICKAGLSAEREVVRALNYVTRPYNLTYKNVYVKDGKEESELDYILLTKEGIIILEVKGTKEDV
ncbi:MAG: NERD domain-containing protein, partial [Lachnospiraceae bacterium]|nr:NERD domain-containing protein [Lachnospiraceae bacterium]